MSAQGGENALITGAAPGGGKPRFVAAAKRGGVTHSLTESTLEFQCKRHSELISWCCSVIFWVVQFRKAWCCYCHRALFLEWAVLQFNLV